MELFIVSLIAVGATVVLMTTIATMHNRIVRQSTKLQEKASCTEVGQFRSALYELMTSDKGTASVITL